MDSYDLNQKTFNRFRTLVYEKAGISLSPAKHQLLKSRLQRRIRTLGLKGFEAYYDLLVTLEDSDQETIDFINAVTTNKTDFFRENHHFQFAVTNAFPKWISEERHEFKIWHAGCSTGEEPYSLKMALADSGLSTKISVVQLATDIDTQVLEHAELGIYAQDRVITIPQATLQRHFLKGKGSKQGFYRIKPELQARLTFRRLNLSENPWPFKPSTRFDMIFCRNVLIYFDKPDQERLIGQFHSLLNPGGFLFLGHSESVHGMQAELHSLGQTIYQAKPIISKRAA